MQIDRLNNNYSVSGQISVEDLTTFKSAGVELLICNRPDNEAADQTPYDDIARAAEKIGIDTALIAFGAGGFSEQQVAQTNALIATGKNIHAYCRTGNRSQMIWAACQQNLSTIGSGSDQPNNVATEPNTSSQPNDTAQIKRRYDVVVVGGGSGGIASAASILKRRPNSRIAIIEPKDTHDYQPGWTMVGGGVFDVRQTRRPLTQVLPNSVDWIRLSVTAFQPEDNAVVLDSGEMICYQQLVISAGIKLNWSAIEGLEETLGKNGVTSNYLYELAPYTWELVQNFKRGKAIFTQPPMPIKCAGAPQKALYLSASHWLKTGVINDINIDFYNAGGVLFGVPDYVPALQSYIDKYNTKTHFLHKLVKIDGASKTAWFETNNEQGEVVTLSTQFDIIHVCPPQCAPDFIANSSLSDADGWLDVDPSTLQHKRVKNIWGLGDATNTSNAKTMAAARKQAPVVAQNVVDALDNKAPLAAYDGYGSCPLTVEHGKIVLAEFCYNGRVTPSFPRFINDGTKPTRFAWRLKTTLLPALYWHGMLKGREWLTKPTA